MECFKHHGVTPTLFFFNPNIHPRDEYLKRRDELIELAKLLDFPYIIPEYVPKAWFDKIRGFEKEPERGKRCTLCFDHRLLATAQYAKDHGFSHFATTLATSRWKNREQVDGAAFRAQEATGVPYWCEDWRKEGLVGRRYELVKEFNFYNQQYCGCIYSKEETEATKKATAAKLAAQAKLEATANSENAEASAPSCSSCNAMGEKEHREFMNSCEC